MKHRKKCLWYWIDTVETLKLFNIHSYIHSFLQCSSTNYFPGFYFISIEQNKSYSSWQVLKPFAGGTVGISKDNYLRSIKLELCGSHEGLLVTSLQMASPFASFQESVSCFVSQLTSHDPVFFWEYIFTRYLRLAVLILGKTMPVWEEYILASNRN